MKHIHEPDTYSSEAQYLLWSAKLKATPGRIALLESLEKEHDPISAPLLMRKIPRTLDRVSIYRALEALVKAGLVKRINTDPAHSSYELAFGRKHHHHAVCTSCGLMEDVAKCDEKELEAIARRSTKNFGHINSHSLEFFGICRSCEKKAA